MIPVTSCLSHIGQVQPKLSTSAPESTEHDKYRVQPPVAGLKPDSNSGKQSVESDTFASFISFITVYFETFFINFLTTHGFKFYNFNVVVIGVGH